MSQDMGVPASPSSHSDEPASGLAANAGSVPNALIALAERCEAAEGPDRELDIAILTHPAIGYRDVHGDGRLFDRGNDGYWFVDDCSIHQLPSPTASPDAALSLVPEGWPSVCVGCTDDGAWYAALAGNDMHMMAEDPDEFYVEADAATPALALCAVALRARAAL